MPTYAQSVVYHEDGVGDVEYRLLLSDSYAGLTDAPTDVGLFDIDSVKQDLDLDTGVFAADQLAVTAYAARIMTTDDADCLDFVLAARDPANKVFCAVLLDPHDPIEVGDFDFRGLLKPEMQGDDRSWSGAQYGDAPTPLRTWKFTALSYDVAEILGARISDVVDGVENGLVAGLDATWQTANVADRQGYFLEPAGSWGYRGVRWGELVSFEVVIQKLLELAAPAGLTITYVDEDTEFMAVPARYHAQVVEVTGITGALTGGTHKLRYCQVPPDTVPNPRAWTAWPSEMVPLRAGGDDTLEGSLWVSFRLLQPREEEREASWLAYESIGDLLYALAAAFNMYLEVAYVDTTHIEVRFAGRSTLDGGECYIRDVTQAQIDLKPLVADEKRKPYRGNATIVVREGDRVYRYDGYGFTPSRADDAPQTEGELLPLTVSPTVCWLLGRGEDTGIRCADIAGGYHIGQLPHNAIFYDSATDPKPQAAEGFAEYNRVGLHTAMYIRTTGKSEATHGEVGVEDETIFSPVAYLLAGTPDGDRWIGNEYAVLLGHYPGLADYLNDVRHRDRAYFSGEYQLTVPGLMCFRSTPAGADDWRNLKRACRITLDGVEWVVVGIERQYKARRTVLRLQAVSRFSIPLPSVETTLPADPSSVTLFKPTPPDLDGRLVVRSAAETDLVAFTVGVVTDDGTISVAMARSAQWGLGIGIILHDAEVGDDVDMQMSGRVQFPEGTTFATGARVYVRDPVGMDPTNLSFTPLGGVDGSEDMLVDIGYCDSDTSIILEPPVRAVLQWDAP